MSEEVTFGNWLKQRLNKLGVTQEEFSERLGFSPAMLRKLQSGERRPSGQIAHLLADYFRIPADEREAFVLFARSGRPATGEVGARAPWRANYTYQTNLPTVLTPIIGRESDVVALQEQLVRSKTRLLTLIGPPGIGKTRLALQVASGLLEHFDDGVFFVDLAPTVDPDQVLPSVARTLGLKDLENRPAAEVLLEHVRGKQMLLVLDNFEQVLDAAPQVTRLLEGSPWIKIVVTSREALHVRGERHFQVPPLRVPDLRLALTEIEQLGTYSSVQLFVERAQSVAPDFSLQKANAEDVAAVCLGVEGLPLAIELAAARARHLTPREMRMGLTSRLALLRGGARDLPARHRTLHAAIGWSYNLLEEAEERLFRRLGVFVGGFTLAAVEGVADDPTTTQGVLLSLVAKNLVKEESQGSLGRVGLDQGRRFGLLETLREFALDRLAGSGEIEAARWQHATYYVELAEGILPRLPSPESKALYDQLEKEHDNFRAALEWLLGYGSTDRELPRTLRVTQVERIEYALRLCCALWALWLFHGHITEGRKWFEAVHSKVVELLGPTTGAVDSIRAASSLSPSLPFLWAMALSGLGLMTQYQADYDAATSFHEWSLAMRREVGDKMGTSASLYNLGDIAAFQGRYEVARHYHQEALDLARQLEQIQDRNPRMNNILTSLGRIECAVENYLEARALLEEALALTREIGNDLAAAVALDNLGLVAYHLGEYTLARRYYDEALNAFNEHGDKHSVALTLIHFGLLLHDQGSYGDALALYREALILLRELGDRLLIAQCLEGIAGVLGVNGPPGEADAAMAARLYGAASVLREGLQCPLRPSERAHYERYMAVARAQLDEATWEAGWSEGRIMPMSKVIDWALGHAPNALVDQ